MEKIDEILKKVKELDKEERKKYLEGLLKIVKDKKLLKKIQELIAVLDKHEEQKEEPLQETLSPRRTIPSEEFDPKYEAKKRRVIPKGLEQTVEEVPLKKEDTQNQYFISTTYESRRDITRDDLLDRKPRTQEVQLYVPQEARDQRAQSERTDVVLYRPEELSKREDKDQEIYRRVKMRKAT